MNGWIVAGALLFLPLALGLLGCVRGSLAARIVALSEPGAATTEISSRASKLRRSGISDTKDLSGRQWNAVRYDSITRA